MKINREGLYLLAIIILLGVCGQFYYSYHYRPIKEREINVYYNQNIKANEKIIQAIQNADEYVYFAIYTFTRSDIKDALLGAKHRGLIVEGLTDKNQLQQSEQQEKIIKELREAGIPLAVQNHSGLMHIKTLVTEKAYISGSYNWTTAATETNDEILEIGYDPTIRRQYEKTIKEVLDKYPKYQISNFQRRFTLDTGNWKFDI
jgi:phosphatidylserine/phosphatidylglycerophosphate/cardiolipin synthase-like enzyme